MPTLMYVCGKLHRAVEIVAQHMVTDMPGSFERSFMDLSGAAMAREAARKCYQDSKMTAADVDVLEVGTLFFIRFLAIVQPRVNDNLFPF